MLQRKLYDSHRMLSTGFTDVAHRNPNLSQSVCGNRADRSIHLRLRHPSLVLRLARL